MLHLGREAGTPSGLVVFLLWEGVAGKDPNFWALLPSATYSWTDRPLEARAMEINHCLLASCVCSVIVPGLALLYSFQIPICHYTTHGGAWNLGGPHVMCLNNLALKKWIVGSLCPLSHLWNTPKHSPK